VKLRRERWLLTRITSRFANRVIAMVGRCRLTLSNPSRTRGWFQRFKLKCDKPLSNFAFTFNLRRYTMALKAWMEVAGKRRTRRSLLGKIASRIANRVVAAAWAAWVG
jgi:hypothetical protein